MKSEREPDTRNDKMSAFTSIRLSHITVCALFFVFLDTPVFSDYYVTGKTTGKESSFLGFVSKTVNVDALKQNGRWFELSDRYAEVSSYSNGRCWIDFGWAMKGINAWKSTSFYEIKDGTPRKLDLSEISFPCVKR